MSDKFNGSTADVISELRRAGAALSRCADLLDGSSPTRDAPPGVDVGGPLLTAKQLGAIRVIAKKTGLSRDQLARLVRQASGKDALTRLSRLEASDLIDRLKSMNGTS